MCIICKASFAKTGITRKFFSLFGFILFIYFCLYIMKSIVHTDLIFILPWTKYYSRFTPFGALSQ